MSQLTILHLLRRELFPEDGNDQIEEKWPQDLNQVKHLSSVDSTLNSLDTDLSQNITGIVKFLHFTAPPRHLINVFLHNSK